MAKTPNIDDWTREELISALAECVRLSGDDSEGEADRDLAPRAVDAVRQLRKDYDAAPDTSGGAH